MSLSEQPNGSPEVEINWAQSHADHLVQWYKNDGELVDAVSGYLSHTLGRGEAAIVISTDAHRNRIEERLQSAGFDAPRLQRTGRYIALDAAETLDRFMVDGQPDQQKFFDVVGTTVSRASNSWNGVRAFGEMVGLLWQQ